MAFRGRGRRGRGSRTPRSSCRGHGRPTAAPSSSSKREGVWCYDFLLAILSPAASRFSLPFSFAFIVSKLNRRGLWIRLQGCPHSPVWIDLEVDNSFLVFLGPSWR